MSEEEFDNFLENDDFLEEKSKKNDDVEHPAHYTDGKIEVIDYIEDANLGFHLGNAIKYISRAGKKNPEKYQEDLDKATWYIKRYCERKNCDCFELTEDFIEDKKISGMTANVVRLIACLVYDD